LDIGGSAKGRAIRARTNSFDRRGLTAARYVIQRGMFVVAEEASNRECAE
jgi:hypothetical protein